MRANLLALNDGKTEIVWFFSRFKDVKYRVAATDVRIDDVKVSAVCFVRDLGVMMDSTGIMNIHINNVCKAAAHSLWRIGKLRKLLDQYATEKLIHAFVISRLDYCNSLFFGLSGYHLKKLQHIQNAAARLVVRRRIERHADMVPILQELHWLPVEFRIQFKLLSIILF